MGFSTHMNKVWESLGPVLGSIPTLKFITLGSVTAPVISVLLNNIKGIKHFEVCCVPDLLFAVSDVLFQTLEFLEFGLIFLPLNC